MSRWITFQDNGYVIRYRCIGAMLILGFVTLLSVVFPFAIGQNVFLASEPTLSLVSLAFLAAFLMSAVRSRRVEVDINRNQIEVLERGCLGGAVRQKHALDSCSLLVEQGWINDRLNAYRGFFILLQFPNRRGLRIASDRSIKKVTDLLKQLGLPTVVWSPQAEAARRDAQ